MIFGHLPAGYLASKLLVRRFGLAGPSAKRVIRFGLVGALAPDLDMLYFYFVDHGQHHHHTYWTHYPIVWVALLLISVTLKRCARAGKLAACSTIFSFNGLIHMLLDTIVGDVWWFAPFLDKPFTVYTVSSLYQPWWLNFILHWSFALEMAIVVGPCYLWRRDTALPAL